MFKVVKGIHTYNNIVVKRQSSKKMLDLRKIKNLHIVFTQWKIRVCIIYRNLTN